MHQDWQFDVHTASPLQGSARPPSPLIHAFPLPTSLTQAERGDPFGTRASCTPASYETSACSLLAAGREVTSEEDAREKKSIQEKEEGEDNWARGRLRAVELNDGREESEGFDASQGKSEGLERRRSTNGEGMFFRARSSSPVRVLKHRAVWPKQRTGAGDVGAGGHNAVAVQHRSSGVAGDGDQGEVERVYNGALM